MYIQDSSLVLLAQRWSQQNTQSLVNKGARTNVVVYDIADVSNP
jgi:hypothetical protein